MINAKELLEELKSEQAHEGQFVIVRRTKDKLMLEVHNTLTDTTFVMKANTFLKGCDEGIYIPHDDGSYTSTKETTFGKDLDWE